jgi:putative Mg2+ transporter-C (MgtC) family protein
MPAISPLQFALHLFIAIALGALVGLERQWRQRMAGTRTNALVCAGASAFVMSGLLVQHDDTAEGRIVSYVVSGVGFLGAGVIFKDAGNVRGLNTAATIWCSAAVGVLTGLGALPYAVILAIGVLLTNILLRPLAYRLHPVLPSATPLETLYEIRLSCRTEAIGHLRSLLLSLIAGSSPVTLQGIHSEEVDSPRDLTNLRAEVTTAGSNNQAIEQIVVRLSIEPDIETISWSAVQTTME